MVNYLFLIIVVGIVGLDVFASISMNLFVMATPSVLVHVLCITGGVITALIALGFLLVIILGTKLLSDFI